MTIVGERRAISKERCAEPDPINAVVTVGKGIETGADGDPQGCFGPFRSWRSKLENWLERR